MEKVNFCYEISEDAGMAHKEDGTNAKAYIKASFDVKEPLSEEEHQRLHEVLMINNISSQTGIEKDLFTPISYEEYLRDADDDED